MEDNNMTQAELMLHLETRGMVYLKNSEYTKDIKQ